MSLAPNQLLTWPVVLAIWIATAGITLLLTAHERRVSAATRARWISVTLLGTAVVMAPLWVAVVLGEAWWPPFLRPTDQTFWSRFGEVRTTPFAVSGVVAAVGALVLWRQLLAWMRPERAMLRQKGALPEVDDAAVRARVVEIARAMGVAVPRVLKLRLHSEKVQALAWASGALRPIVVVTDGLLRRLPAKERDAVVAHEIGHIAQRTIWIYLAVAILAWLTAVLCSSWLPVVNALVLGLFLTLFGLRVVGHWSEADCDRRGARVVGHAAMAAALGKVHATAGIDPTHRLAPWVHATQTHPSMVVRADLLYRDAPEVERAEIEHDAAAAKSDRRAYLIAVALQLAIAAAAIYFGSEREHALAAFLILIFGLIAPALLLISVGWSPIADYLRLGMVRFPWVSLLRFGAIVLAISAPVVGVMVSEVSEVSEVGEVSEVNPRIEPVDRRWFETPTLFFAVGAVSLLLFAFAGRRRRLLNRHLALSLREQRYLDAVSAIDASSRRLQRDPLIRYQRALALALAGRREEGLEAAQQLLSDHPRLGATITLVASLQRNQDTAGVLAMIEANQSKVPVWWYWALRSGLLRRLGRLGDATEAAQVACQKAPRKGIGWQMLAWAEIDRGNYSEAERCLAAAEVVDPGSGRAAVVRLALAIGRGDDPETIDVALARARELASVNPLAFLDLDIDVLVSRRGTRSASSTPGPLPTDP